MRAYLAKLPAYPREALVIYASLLALLAVNLLLAVLPLGVAKPFLIIAVAAIQAGIILWYSMEVRRQDGLVKLFAVIGFFFVLILFGLGLADYLTREGGYSEPPSAGVTNR